MITYTLTYGWSRDSGNENCFTGVAFPGLRFCLSIGGGGGSNKKMKRSGEGAVCTAHILRHFVVNFPHVNFIKVFIA